MQVGVFVSLVSTKIPFKGAGKEYIGMRYEIMQRVHMLYVADGTGPHVSTARLVHAD